MHIIKYKLSASLCKICWKQCNNNACFLWKSKLKLQVRWTHCSIGVDTLAYRVFVHCVQNDVLRFRYTQKRAPRSDIVATAHQFIANIYIFHTRSLSIPKCYFSLMFSGRIVEQIMYGMCLRVLCAQGPYSCNLENNFPFISFRQRIISLLHDSQCLRKYEIRSDAKFTTRRHRKCNILSDDDVSGV